MSFSRSAWALAVGLAVGVVPAAAQRLRGHAMGQAIPSMISAALQLALAHGTLGVQPFVELTLGQVGDVGAGLFRAEALYGTTSVRGLTIGTRLDLGGMMGRMGRYGVVAVPEEQVMGEMHGHTH